MKDAQCIRFLQWALPQLNMQWSGFRKVRKQVCKRIDRRVRDLGLNSADEYRGFLQDNPQEWQALDSLCTVTISRFYRDRDVFAALAEQVLPALVRGARIRGDKALRAWSAGCASGEEPYTLSLLWAFELQQEFPDMTLAIVATDSSPDLLRRARAARFRFSSLRELPQPWREQAFSRANDGLVLKRKYTRNIGFTQQDIRRAQPGGRFDLVLCRNLVFTYFDEDLRQELLRKIVGRLHAGGALVLGRHEDLPQDIDCLSVWPGTRGIWRKRPVKAHRLVTA